MSTSRIVRIERLPSGVSKLDDILGGGWPEFSFNLIVGEPGSGKTTLAHQFMFANASEERPALYFTVLGEPTIKMLRYQQQFAFFDMSKVNRTIHFANLTDEALANDLERVLDGHRREGRCDRAAHRDCRFVPDARAGAGDAWRHGHAGVRAAAGDAAHVVAGHDVPARRISRSADPRGARLHHGRRLDLAHPASRPELDGPPGARCSRCVATAHSPGCTPSASPPTACRPFRACSSRSRRRRAMCRANWSRPASAASTRCSAAGRCAATGSSLPARWARARRTPPSSSWPKA